MAQLNTRIILRNDSSANWLTNESVVLLKGEVGIEFLTNGKVMMKIGDGVKSWGELSYFGGASESNVLEVVPEGEETHADAIARITSDLDEVHVGDVVIVNADERIAYIYNGSNWLAMSTEFANDIADLQTKIEELTTTVENHTTEIQTVKETLETQSETITEVQTKVETIYKDGTLDVYTKSETYNRDEIAQQIAAADHLKRKIVVSADSIDLDAADAEQYIYMAPNDAGTYDEYMVIDGALEKVGDWKIDLTDYAKTADVEAELAKKADIATTLAGYGISDAYTKTEVDALIGAPAVSEEDEEGNETIITPASGIYANVYTREEIADLIADITGGESAADVLAALNAYKGTNDARVKVTEDRLDVLEAVGAQANVIEAVAINGVDLAITDKRVNIAIAGADLGVVKSSDTENGVAVDAEGVMTVNNLNANKLIQTEGEYLILNGGSSSLNI